jgi:hypothetical protein
MLFSIFHFLKHYYNGIFHISFFKALLINEGKATRGKRADLYRVNLKDDPRCVCGHLLEDAIHFFLECPLYQHDRTSLFNYFNNIVPISNVSKKITFKSFVDPQFTLNRYYIIVKLINCVEIISRLGEISEEFNTLFFKSVQKLVDLIINYPQP